MKLIDTESDYQAALKRMEVLFDAPASTEESDEADVLAMAIDAYENEHYAIEALR